jgi:hypothetical protein
MTHVFAEQCQKKGFCERYLHCGESSNKPYPSLLNLIPFIFAYGKFLFIFAEPSFRNGNPLLSRKHLICLKPIVIKSSSTFMVSFSPISRLAIWILSSLPYLSLKIYSGENETLAQHHWTRNEKLNIPRLPLNPIFKTAFRYFLKELGTLLPVNFCPNSSSHS